jgi:hypothetical protein
MPEVVSLGLCAFGVATLQAYAKGGTATSDDAEAARTAASAIVKRVETSQALFGEKAAALSRLSELSLECSQPDWDGYGAEPIQAVAVWNARKFLTFLPEGIPIPDVGVEPGGSIALDWLPEKNRVFAISIGTTNRLAYAWLDGSDKGHGVSTFDGAEIPLKILQGIQEISKNG